LLPIVGYSQGKEKPIENQVTIVVTPGNYFPRVGKDNKGNKYMVLAADQDRMALKAIIEAEYTDSLYERLQIIEANSQQQLAEYRFMMKTVNTMLDNHVEARQKTFEMYMEEKSKNEPLTLALDAQKSENKKIKKTGIILATVGGVTFVGGVLIAIKSLETLRDR
jgi:hypothetical protein